MRFFYLILLLTFLSYSASAQNFKGLVVGELQEPIFGANILHENSDYHTHTNDLGQFVVRNAQIGDTIQIIHIGFEPKIYLIKKLDEQVRIELTASFFDLGEVVVGQNTKNTNIISRIDVETVPVRSAQEVLRKVPGLFIGQHAGGGKAEQIFLRGFDIDHGTDVQITVDGMPVNMVSHAHGQGYADLHFVIPETIDLIDYGKGPYYADKGNFNTAGYVQFKTKDQLEQSQIAFEVGQFNTQRAVGMFKVLDTEKHNVYLATEYLISDGPFDAPQNFYRSNFMAKYSGELAGNTRLTFLASHFDSKWDASGQIPQRLVDRGVISRFGAVDDTEGGTTGRTNIAMSLTKPVNENTFVKTNAYYSLYDFELFSNFTFFLNDPVNGDQIKQRENRNIFGFESTWNHNKYLNDVSATFRFGVGMRADQINGNELSNTLNRKTTLSSVQIGDVDEKNMYAFADAEFDAGNWLFQPGLRLDYFKFNYQDQLATLYDNQSQTKATLSPKFNIVYNANDQVQLYLKSGIGFHSNDTRVVLEGATENIIPAAYGVDLGTFFKPVPRLFTNVALWYLALQQEFVYVGDAGVVEPSGRTRRYGVDFTFRYQLKDWLFINGDVNYAHARSIEDPEGSNLIPLAPTVTSTAGISFNKNKFNGGLQFRYLKDRPANEDNSIVAEGYYIFDLNANYTMKRITLGFSIENLLNQEWNETQFATESRLQFEQNPVEEIHFTPGSPLFIKGMVKYNF